jgi:hypothetical protein
LLGGSTATLTFDKKKNVRTISGRVYLTTREGGEVWWFRGRVRKHLISFIFSCL